MALSRETTVARADMNDEFGVTIWQAKKTADYTIAEARELAAEIVRAANEAERIRRDDAWRSEGNLPPGFGFDIDLTAPPVKPVGEYRIMRGTHTEPYRPAVGEHILLSDHNGDPRCGCGYSPSVHEAVTQVGAAALIQRHVKENR